jgi:2-polyprenyl-3-methyl-5-hydroxy-6-metoxy-1,4-benzoquinol methylase
MDDVAKYNIERWAALAQAEAVFTRPRLDLTPADTRALAGGDNRLGDVAGKRVLCLAGGGGQQSVAFALLGADVTVADLSVEQLQRDEEAAAHYNLHVTTVQADMRDLFALAAASFDVVYQPYSINFVPDARVVFREVARVLQVGGVYHFTCANPFTGGLVANAWNGTGYPLQQPYVDGAELTYVDEPWVFGGAAPQQPVNKPKEYRHTLSRVINGLVEHGFVLLHVSDYSDFTPNPNAEPGTWAHFVSFAPPWLQFWASYQPKASE